MKEMPVVLTVAAILVFLLTRASAAGGAPSGPLPDDLAGNFYNMATVDSAGVVIGCTSRV